MFTPSEETTGTPSEKVGATPSGEYSWRPPSPPNIKVSPNTEKMELPPYNGFEHDAKDREVLQIITESSHHSVGWKNWRYELRRKSQPILSFLFLGPSSAARDLEALRANGITMLLVIRNTMTANASIFSGDKVAAQLGIKADAINVSGNQELIAAFPRAIKSINDHLIATYHQWISNGGDPACASQSSPGKVLVSCETGNERSACVVAAYLMSMYGVDLVKAIQYIQSERFCIAFDDNIKHLLLNYQQILEAQKAVSLVSFQTQSIAATMGKRGRDDMNEDGDMDTDEFGDAARFAGRHTFSPFIDSLARLDIGK